MEDDINNYENEAQDLQSAENTLNQQAPTSNPLSETMQNVILPIIPQVVNDELTPFTQEVKIINDDFSTDIPKTDSLETKSDNLQMETNMVLADLNLCSTIQEDIVTVNDPDTIVSEDFSVLVEKSITLNDQELIVIASITSNENGENSVITSQNRVPIESSTQDKTELPLIKEIVVDIVPNEHIETLGSVSLLEVSVPFTNNDNLDSTASHDDSSVAIKVADLAGASHIEELTFPSTVPELIEHPPLETLNEIKATDLLEDKTQELSNYIENKDLNRNADSDVHSRTSPEVLLQIESPLESELDIYANGIANSQIPLRNSPKKQTPLDSALDISESNNSLQEVSLIVNNATTTVTEDCAISLSANALDEDQYESPSPIQMDEEFSQPIVIAPHSAIKLQQWTSQYGRGSSSSSSASDTESTLSEASLDSNESYASCFKEKGTKFRKKRHSNYLGAKTTGELDVQDLPPIEALHITVPKQDIHHLGKISSIIGCLVIVQSFKNEQPLNLDSVLFTNHGTSLGKVFDVFGRVTEPFYSVRFNSESEIISKGFTVGDKVFSAPSHQDVTYFVFAEDLMKQKGSDASWQDNNEPPDDCIEFSDDEQEKMHKQKLRAKRRDHCSDVNVTEEIIDLDVKPQFPDREIKMARRPRPLIRPPRFNNNHNQNTNNYNRFPPPNSWTNRFPSSPNEFGGFNPRFPPGPPPPPPQYPLPRPPYSPQPQFGQMLWGQQNPRFDRPPNMRQQFPRFSNQIMPEFQNFSPNSGLLSPPGPPPISQRFPPGANMPRPPVANMQQSFRWPPNYSSPRPPLFRP